MSLSVSSQFTPALRGCGDRGMARARTKHVTPMEKGKLKGKEKVTAAGSISTASAARLTSKSQVPIKPLRIKPPRFFDRQKYRY